MSQSVTITIGGPAGFGIMAAGTMLTRAFVRHGYHAIAQNEYPSLIRGGHNVVTIQISTEPLSAITNGTDILLALNRETYELHKKELKEESVILVDPKDNGISQKDIGPNVRIVSLPMTDIVERLGGSAVMRNTVALGAVVSILGADSLWISDVIADQFGRKGKTIVEENLAGVKAGYDYIKNSYASLSTHFLQKPQNEVKRFVMNGSEALGIGALDGGMQFAAIYPMTPINSLITLFADHEKELGIVYKQPEDEIAGINMAIGASLGGVKSLVATSGGGFSLMVEGLSLSGIMEVPLVIDLGMRPGPATGMPTFTGQGELLFSIFSGHGEFPRVVLAPGDVNEAYKLSKQAFELAWHYQIPVFLLTDKYLNETQWSIDTDVFSGGRPAPDMKEQTHPKGFARYRLAPDGVSARSFPGEENGMYIANSYEHDEKGFTVEEGEAAKKMTDKRMAKLAGLQGIAAIPESIGEEVSDCTFVSWGSVKGVILEAMKILGRKGIKAKLLHFSWLFPLMGEKISEILSKEKRLVLVEGNSTGQLAKLLRMETGNEIKEKILKYNGRQFQPEEIVEQINKSDKSTNKQMSD